MWLTKEKQLTPDEIAAAKLRTAFDLFTAGLRMKRQTLKHRHPDASDQAINEMIQAWLQERPGAREGDSNGRIIEWPRKTSPVASKAS